MPVKKRLCVFSLTFLLFESVVAWTIDLPEARKYYFEKYKSKNNEIENDQITNNRPYYNFDNINTDSPLNKKEYDLDYNKEEHKIEGDENGNYAGGFGYQGYTEKKVTDVVHKGSQYLEGLNQAIQRYGEMLQNCTRFNRTDESRNSSWLPENDVAVNFTITDEVDCERASQSSEYVRRLAALALWATRELQDFKYNERYQGPSHESEQEENELILRLAWFLDRLAHLTGFEPDGKPYASTPRSTTPTSTQPPFSQLPPLPEDVKSTLLSCMDSNGGPERCRYPLPLPVTEEVRRIFGVPGNQPLNSLAGRPDNTDSPTNPNELLIPTESRQITKSVKKRSIDDNPLLHVVKYYAKHKVWDSSNPIDGNEDKEYDSEGFIDRNDIKFPKNTAKIVRKRSISNKKAKIHLPEDPNQDLSSYLKHKSGVNYIKSPQQIDKIQTYMNKIRDSSPFTAKTNLKKLEKSMRSLKKRSIERNAYYRKKEQPRISEDPEQDISYYVKNKRGINYVANLAEVAQVRAGLEQVYQTGNIETVRRYGSNYNPAVPNPLLAGIAEAMTDA